MQQYNVNITGGSEKVKYFVGANILMQGGLFKHGNYNENYSTNVKYTKYNFRSNLDFQLSSIFSAKLNLAGVIGDKHRPSPGGDVNTILTVSRLPILTFLLFVIQMVRGEFLRRQVLMRWLI